MSRLKPPPRDSYGLTSRDDTRLLEPGNFSSFWKSTKLKVDQFLEESDDIDVLSHHISNLSIDSKFGKPSVSRKRPESLLSDLRKLREAVISLRKQDIEAQEILLVSCKIGILAQHSETYLPSLTTLLQFPTHPPEIHGWYSLYLLFILEDPVEFYTFTITHPVNKSYLSLAKSLINNDYITYTNLLETSSRYDKALIVSSPADTRLKNRLIEVINKSYYRVNVTWLNRLLGIKRIEKWPQEENMYIIKRAKAA